MEYGSSPGTSTRLGASLRWSQALWRRPLATIVLIGLASRLFFFVITLVAATHVEQWPEGTWQRGPAWVQPFARWDSGYYLDIAAQGYGDRIEFWAFHPAYPLGIRALTTLVPGLAPEVAGFLLSNACFLVALPLFYRFTLRHMSSDAATRAVAFLSWFPAAVFFTAIYPESLFLIFLVLSLSAFEQERWASAGLWAAAANAARPQGLFLAPAFAAIIGWRWLQGRGYSPRSLLAPLLGLGFVGGFSLYAWRVSGDAFIWWKAREAVWPDVGWHDPFTTVWRAFTQIDNYGLSVLGLVFLMAAGAYSAWRVTHVRISSQHAAHTFTLVLLLVHSVYAATPSLLRYCLACLPLFWMLGAHTYGWRLVLALTTSAILSAFVAYLYGVWGPAF